jgi:hypothetical protein
MHTTPTGPSELLTLRHQIEIERLRLKLTMIRVQTSALETLERYMEVQEPTGDDKKDKAEATTLNRQRLAANQALIHCRSAERENRLARVGQASSPPSSPSPLRGRRWQPTEGRMTDEGAVDASPLSTSGCAADPSPQPSPAHFQTGGEGDEPSDDSGAAAQAEGAGHADSPAQNISSHGFRPITERTQTLPPQRKRSRYKTRKPKRPKHPRKRKR